MEAEHFRTAWRLHYKMPPTDPRYQQATDEEVLHDLLVLHFHGRAVEEAVSPQAALERALADDPGKFDAIEQAARTLPRIKPPSRTAGRRGVAP